MHSRLAIAGIATLLGLAVLPAHARSTWTKVDHAPVARFNPAVTTGPDGRIYVFGGHYSSESSSYIPIAHAEAFDPSTDPSFAPAWTALPPMPTPRGGASAVVANGKDGKPRIFVIGGLADSTVTPNALVALPTVEAYDPAMRTWSSCADMPTARALFAAATGRDGRIYAIGGYDGGGQGLSTVEAYEPGIDRWAAPPDGGFAPMPTPRYVVASTLGHDGRIYVFGGSQYAQTLRTVEAYDTVANSWDTTLPPMARLRYAAAAVTALDGRLFVIGGHQPSGGDGELGDVEIFDGARWTTSTAALSTPRHDLGAAVDLQGRIYAIAGYHGGEVNLVERLTP